MDIKSGIRAIDCWVNLDSKWDTIPDWLVRVQEEYFKSTEVNKQVSMDEMLQIMDEAGVEKSILTVYPHKVPESTLEYVRQREQLAVVKGVRRVAPGAAQGTARQTNKDRGAANRQRLALQGEEDFCNPDAVGC